jgi:hypothetical protein
MDVAYKRLESSHRRRHLLCWWLKAIAKTLPTSRSTPHTMSNFQKRKHYDSPDPKKNVLMISPSLKIDAGFRVIRKIDPLNVLDRHPTYFDSTFDACDELKLESSAFSRAVWHIPSILLSQPHDERFGESASVPFGESSAVPLNENGNADVIGASGKLTTIESSVQM